MKVLGALCRVLSIMAMVILVFGPPATPAGAAGVRSPGTVMPMADDGAAAMSDDMPCCPPDAPAQPDCKKSCPFLALCMTQLLVGSMAVDTVPFRPSHLTSTSAWDDVIPDDPARPRLPRPPNS